MENVKNKRRKSGILLGMAAGVALMAVGIWSAFFMKKSNSLDAKAYVDGRIETGDSEVDQAYEKFFSSDPADVIRDQGEEPEASVSILFRGLNDEVEVNEAVLKRLEETEIKASFALSASELMENKDYVSRSVKADQELISNGTDGSGNLQNRAVKSMIEDMLKSRKTISSGADVDVPLLYCDSELTADVLTAASVSGYEALVDPEETHIITDNTFLSREEMEKYTDSLRGHVIFVFDLRGNRQPIAEEAAVQAEKPAIDKQADLDETVKAPKEEPVSVQEQFEWLTEVLEEKGIAATTVGSMEKISGTQVLRWQTTASDAEKAVVYRYCLTKEAAAGVGVVNLPEKGMLDSLLAELAQNAVKATFFVSRQELEKRGGEIQKIVEAGHSVGLTDGGEETGTAEEAFDSIQAGIRALCQYTEDPAHLYYVQKEENLDAVRISARLLNVKVLQPEEKETPVAGSFCFLDARDRQAVSGLKKAAGKAGLTLSDIQTLIQNSGTIPVVTPEKVSEMRRNNHQELAEVQNMVYTTERAFSFLFYGLDHENAVRDTLNCMETRNGKATFFVTLNELMEKSSLIEEILADGYEVEIAYRAGSDYPQTFDAVLQYLNAWKTYAKWRYEIEAGIVFIPNGKAEDETREALNTAGCTLVESTLQIIKTEDKDIVLDDIPEVIGKLEHIRLTRGAFISFNMGYYENDLYTQRGATIFGVMLDGFMNAHVDTLAYCSNETGEIEDASRFAIHTVSDMLKSPEIYTLQDAKQTDITLDKNVLTNMQDDVERFNYISERYIGTSFVTSENKLPGFTQKEIRQMDIKGRFTDDKVLFLTFDDWGTEQSLNKLLYVLAKHDVKATFFVTTQYADSNPNMLRAIAVQGHQIGSHTDEHLPLSDSVEGVTNKAVTLTEEEVQKLRKDLVTSYDKLYKYTGDVVEDGKPALSKMFRPPTLAVSKAGISQVFDVGFEYSISGDMSTDDYKAASYQDMVNQLRFGITDGGDHISIHDGSIVVMHMLENAKYTAQALDAMIPIWKEQGYTFARIDDYLGR
mgnify:CR=1 FL=1